MTAKEYAAYEANVARFFEREGLDNLSTLPTEDDDGEPIEDRTGEPYFSNRPCECCRRRWAGDRYDCNGYNPTTRKVQEPYAVCVDCVYYAEYGRLDDMTMLDVEKDRREQERAFEEERKASLRERFSLDDDTPDCVLRDRMLDAGMNENLAYVVCGL
jgi:hypothetical protein